MTSRGVLRVLVLGVTAAVLAAAAALGGATHSQTHHGAQSMAGGSEITKWGWE